jgi:hypothetical protein
LPTRSLLPCTASALYRTAPAAETDIRPCPDNKATRSLHTAFNLMNKLNLVKGGANSIQCVALAAQG